MVTHPARKAPLLRGESQQETRASLKGHNEGSTALKSCAVCLRKMNKLGQAPTPPWKDEAPPDLDEILQLYLHRILATARRMTRNEADAEDIAQNVFVQLIRKLGTFRGEAEFTTWLHRITINAVLMYRRENAPRTSRQAKAPVEFFVDHGAEAMRGSRKTPRPDKLVLQSEMRLLLEHAVSELPKRHREVFILAEIEGMANADIGRQLGLSLAAVKSRRHRSRRVLRERLMPFFEERFEQISDEEAS